MHYVYKLDCKDGFYIGCTDNLKDRIERHKKGYVPATKNRLPVKLTIYFAFENKYQAFNFEKYLKTGSGRAFIKNIFCEARLALGLILREGGTTPSFFFLFLVLQ